MIDIAQQIQLESREIQAQERELNIRKIRLAIKTLYTFFEGEEDVLLSNKTLSESVKLLSTAAHKCKKEFEKEALMQEIQKSLNKPVAPTPMDEDVVQFFDDDDEL